MLSQEVKLEILREWEQDALRLSASEGEGFCGGEDSMLGRVEDAITLVQNTILIGFPSTLRRCGRKLRNAEPGNPLPVGLNGRNEPTSPRGRDRHLSW